MPRLRHSNVHGPGITRRRRGKGFSYAWTTGERVDDPETLDRIRALVIPPAWQEVWICPWPHGHIQAVGIDVAGRRQYRYHDDWRRRRDQEKFERAIELGRAMPTVRKAVAADLAEGGLGRRRVLAAAVRLLDLGCFRIGDEEYAEEHGTFGVATLKKEHVRVHGDELVFDYLAKGSIPRNVVVADAGLAEVIGALRRRRGGGEDLLVWKEGQQWVDVRSGDINEYIKEVAGEQFSAKDFRTWSATVAAAAQLAAVMVEGASPFHRKRLVAQAVKEVAEQLGNTPSVCRASYVDPRVIDRFHSGECIKVQIGRLEQGGGSPDLVKARRAAEAAVIDLLSEAAAVA